MVREQESEERAKEELVRYILAGRVSRIEAPNYIT